MTLFASAIVLAAGAGRRMGQDKALLSIDGAPLIERVLATLGSGGCSELVVVRSEGAAALPASVLSDPRVRVTTIPAGREMIESVRAGVAARSSRADVVVLLPVDHGLVASATVAALLGKLATSPAVIALPIANGKPGHPIAMRASCADEVRSAATLREVIRRDAARVASLVVADPFVTHDLDTPDDLARAELILASSSCTALDLMRAHRSRRAYGPEPVADAVLTRLVDAARHASTSSGMQASAVVAVRDPARRAEIASLCSDQQHVREAPVFLAVCADLHKIAVACERTGKRLRSEGLEVFLQATIDAALLAQNLALAAESIGLGICMIGAARNHPVALARLLGLPPHVYVAFGMTMGVPTDDPIPRGRMALSGMLHHERYEIAAVEPALASMDTTMREWAARTNRERGGYQGKTVDETRGWCERMAKLWGEAEGAKSRGNLLAELRELGFLG